jgi:hypothetical protein
VGKRSAVIPTYWLWLTTERVKMKISYETGYYNNDIVIQDGNTKIVHDISNGRKVYCQGYFADQGEAETLFDMVDSISEDVKDSKEFRRQMIEDYFSDVIDEIKEEWEEQSK